MASHGWGSLRHKGATRDAFRYGFAGGFSKSLKCRRVQKGFLCRGLLGRGFFLLRRGLAHVFRSFRGTSGGHDMTPGPSKIGAELSPGFVRGPVSRNLRLALLGDGGGTLPQVWLPEIFAVLVMA